MIVNVSTPASELVSAFSKVITNLDNDVSRLRDLASIRSSLLAETQDEEYGGGENDDPNGDARGRREQAGARRGGCASSLREAEAALQDVERRAEMLEIVVEEETRAAEDMRRVKEAAESQRELLRGIVENLPDKLPGDAAQMHVPSSSSWSSMSGECSSIDSRSQLPPSDAGVGHPHISVVCSEELSSVQKSIRGRVTLSSLNDAVSDINDVARVKYRALSVAAKGKGKRTKKFHQLIVHHRETIVEEHSGLPFVSEQDLRDCCAFFRSGESTARAVLNVLRSLKRIRQVQGGGGQVTYCIL